MQAWGHPQVGRELGTRGRGAQGQGNMRAATTQGQWVQHVPHGSVPWGLLGVPTVTPIAVTPLQGLSPGAGAVPQGLCCTVPSDVAVPYGPCPVAVIWAPSEVAVL